ncbi:MAG: hypothetical protein ACD_56C00080G0001 [uncultured bacterium]|nr:MAG: hypothetical protein ACD_56C00080G0001 [uncultured bacterium]
MTLKSYLWGMRSAALLSFAVWVLVLKQIDPDSSGLVGKFLFFAATFLFLAGWLILFFTWLRRKIGGGEEMALAYLGMSFRQGIFIALLATLLLIMQSLRVLTWWDSMLTVAGILLLELYFLTRK